MEFDQLPVEYHFPLYKKDANRVTVAPRNFERNRHFLKCLKGEAKGNNKMLTNREYSSGRAEFSKFLHKQSCH